MEEKEKKDGVHKKNATTWRRRALEVYIRNMKKEAMAHFCQTRHLFTNREMLLHIYHCTIIICDYGNVTDQVYPQ